jgi:hypothetical protein
MVQMPALNTPQFEWCKNNMGRQSQPVPPIYQPEVAAGAVYFAATHRRREIYVGASTAIVIAGNKVAPGLGDWYLGKTGYRSQQTDAPPPANRPDNLWKPVDVDQDFGAHGRFDERAHAASLALWLSKHRRGISVLSSAALLLGLAIGTLRS